MQKCKEFKFVRFSFTLHFFKIQWMASNGLVISQAVLRTMCMCFYCASYNAHDLKDCMPCPAIHSWDIQNVSREIKCATELSYVLSLAGYKVRTFVHKRSTSERSVTDNNEEAFRVL